ncbi:Next to BRCA1 gene 1 protein [Heterocephalus glaber]|uniref:Next to BRCA1 gene 1 protein n=1 Tax=Heterocephalus glaber TaxID=10181 RepID=G5B4X7_HETGA|nr:Next to BRCA1 gene 1 protein [Heterocephalus glaber]
MLCRLSVPPPLLFFNSLSVSSLQGALCVHTTAPQEWTPWPPPQKPLQPPVRSKQRHLHGSSIAGGLVKGALSVTASAYKALFSGPPVTAQPIVSEHQTAALMAHLFEMGFCDQQLNLRLLKKHNYNILQVVTELLQLSNNWPSHRY